MAKPSASYTRKLQDPRWQKRRLEVFDKARWLCSGCGSGDKTLHVHHRDYVWGRDPWDYPDDTLECLCSECHEDATYAQKTLKREISGLSTVSMERLIGYARGIKEIWEHDFFSSEHKLRADNYEQAMGLADCFECDVEDVVKLITKDSDGTNYVTVGDLDKSSRLAKQKA